MYVNSLPSKTVLSDLVEQTLAVLDTEPEMLRPADASGMPGGLLYLKSFAPDVPAVLVPDLHGRTGFFDEILSFVLPEDFYGKTPGKRLTVAQALDLKKLYLVCLGDGFHTEVVSRERWKQAYEQWKAGNIRSAAMLGEMSDSLGLMQRVMNCKCRWPRYFHFLKGNHENILNESAHGNLAFGKYTYEGELVRSFMLDVYGESLLNRYAHFEHRLPLFVWAANFLASHAQPLCMFSKDDVINGLKDEAVVLGLTWTDNDEAQKDSVALMLKSFLPDRPDALYFGGHRFISGTYRLKANGKYVQLHNPDKHCITLIRTYRPFNPNTDIYDTSAAAGTNLLQE